LCHGGLRRETIREEPRWSPVDMTAAKKTGELVP